MISCSAILSLFGIAHISGRFNMEPVRNGYLDDIHFSFVIFGSDKLKPYTVLQAGYKVWKGFSVPYVVLQADNEAWKDLSVLRVILLYCETSSDDFSRLYKSL